VKSRQKILLPLLTFGVVILLWQTVASLGIYRPHELPSPGSVFSGILELARTGALWEHIGVSMYRFLAGYLVAAVIAIPLGLISGWYRPLWISIDPLVQILRPISPIAWFPLVGLWFGIGDLPAMFIIFMAAFYPILLSTVSAVKNVDAVYLKVARNFGSSQKHILWKVVIPASFPFMIMGLRMALGTAWVFLVAGEMMGVRSGLGFLIVDARNILRTELVIAGMLIIGVLGLLLDRLIGWFEKKINLRWGMAP